MQGNTTRRASIILGGFMIFVLLLGAIAPLLNQNVTVQATVAAPTTAPTATFPPPMTDFTGINSDLAYLHPTGLFTIGEPAGWLPSPPITEATRAGITMINRDTLSVIEASVEQPEIPVTTLDELDARYTEQYLDSSWSRYPTWEETARRREDDKLVLDFNLTLNRQQYVARQMSWTDGQWIYSARVVTPENAIELLRYLLDGLVNSLHPLTEFVGTPFSWTAYYDSVSNHIIRHPSEWTVEDSAPGRPASITSPNGVALRVETTADTSVADEAVARAWVEVARSGATVLSVAPVERDGSSGFSVAYSFTTVDGEAQSGLAVLLNGADGALHVANLRFAGRDVDLNTVEDAAPEAEATAEATAQPDASALNEATYAEVMKTFTVLPALNLSPSSLPATPTPLPTVAPTAVPPTAEATSEATETAEATGAPEAETTAEAEATAEATAE